MVNKQENTSQYLPQLDALRTFAILGVLVAHNWRPEHLPVFLQTLDGGDLGVRLFFVLSGFLITRILMGCRELADRAEQPSRLLVGRFYARRFLRIFPIYYLVLIVAIVVNVPAAREHWSWLFSYTSNVDITLHDIWIGRLSHFWTLAVEEQFYFVWPWLVLFAPRKWLIPLVCVLIGVAPLYRFWVAAAFPADIATGDFTKGTLTIACMDALGMGALLALAQWSPQRTPQVYRVLNRIVLPVGLASFVILQALGHNPANNTVFYTLHDFSLALLFCWLVAMTSKGIKGWVGAVLQSRPLVYLGKISYGIYVYHYLVPLLLAWAARKLGFTYIDHGFVNFTVASLIAIVLAVVSWQFFENPINNLKRYFNYSAPIRREVQLHATAR